METSVRSDFAFSLMPNSTMRFVPSESDSDNAPAGSNTKISPTIAAREPRKARYA